ncbi:MAG: triose-phosphate isomerase [Rhodospirillales bacterium]|nr:triose-phosphate isomerase [Alphaproteobacteria bacterium]USO03319.1 MAG: triose-phosphate isomerase [Rhodospirillales bacterium]
MKKLIAGNWKMNGTAESAIELAEAVSAGIEGNPGLLDTCDFLICPPFLHIPLVQGALSEPVFDAIFLGAQDCSSYQNGAYTGDVSAAMIADMGCTHVILGHSERRQYFGEKDMLVAEKALLAHREGLTTIVCVGENEAEREAGRAQDVVGKQLGHSLPGHSTPKNLVVAYEPVWAIGTGKSATVEDIRDMHAFIRAQLSERLESCENIRILYGGSVKPANAAEILATENVDGALIGGASLKAEDFIGIAQGG